MRKIIVVLLFCSSAFADSMPAPDLSKLKFFGVRIAGISAAVASYQKNVTDAQAQLAKATSDRAALLAKYGCTLSQVADDGTMTGCTVKLMAKIKKKKK